MLKMEKKEVKNKLNRTEINKQSNRQKRKNMKLMLN